MSANISDTLCDQRSLVHQKLGFPIGFHQEEKGQQKKFFRAAILDHFWAKLFKSETTSFQNFAPWNQKSKKVLTYDLCKWGQKEV